MRIVSEHIPIKVKLCWIPCALGDQPDERHRVHDERVCWGADRLWESKQHRLKARECWKYAPRWDEQCWQWVRHPLGVWSAASKERYFWLQVLDCHSASPYKEASTDRSWGRRFDRWWAGCGCDVSRGGWISGQACRGWESAALNPLPALGVRRGPFWNPRGPSWPERAPRLDHRRDAPRSSQDRRYCAQS